MKYLIFSLALMFLVSCTRHNIIKNFHKPEQLDNSMFYNLVSKEVSQAETETIKFHMKNGEAYILEIIKRDVDMDRVLIAGEKIEKGNASSTKGVFKILFQDIDSINIGTTTIVKPISFASDAIQSLFTESQSHGLHSIRISAKNDISYLVNSISEVFTDSITGWGQKVDINRKLLDTGMYVVDMNQIALIEMDELHPNLNVVALTTSTIVTVALTLFCIANPKACFGSCPTFYAWDGEKMKLMAEGFSSSILPSLEENDIDALYNARPPSDILEIDLTNEAMETHIIRKADVLALLKMDNCRVVADNDGRFWNVGSFKAPDFAIDSKVSSLELLNSFDGKERFTETDSLNLAHKDTFELHFNTLPSDQAGLVIAARQSLVTTFLFYQTLAFMGTKAVSTLAMIDAGSMELQKTLFNSNNIMGGIDVEVFSSGKWIKVETIDEKGPIATDLKLVRLPDGLTSPVKTRFILSKGYIRIDHIAMVDVRNEATPLRIKPSMVYSDGREDLRAFDCLSNNNQPLITYPGDKYRLVYNLPVDFANYEIFMDTKGYYLEWMRKEWLKEENPAMVYLYFTNPTEYFKVLAPMYKRIESTMEENFWNSRYVK